jgi:Mn2+/Fe2+ NRAMP family transporter
MASDAPQEPVGDASSAGSAGGILEPPTTFRGVVRHLGPGLIIAGSIVGSGELIATTKSGAQAGFSLLWLILLGCIIKVFVQIELGRYTLVNGKTTMQGLVEVPGPRIGKGNWLIWAWFVMFVFSLAQLGGIVGGVGQALAISVPFTEKGVEYNDHLSLLTQQTVKEAELRLAKSQQEEGTADAIRIGSLSAELEVLNGQVENAKAALREKLGSDRYRELGGKPPISPDAKIWATLITVVTIGILVYGKYGLIQSFSTALVGMFTFITVYNLWRLQGSAEWAVKFEEVKYGFSLALPDSDTAVATALATFGIIGVGASELVSYPYWCLEKGYAKFTGPRDLTDEWAHRARGWMRVMQWDAWTSMVVYTFATIAFFLLGAAILGRTGLDPEGNEMIRYLSVMYQPVFGSFAQTLFLFGAFAVLYSTFFVANASLARVASDAFRTLGFIRSDEANYRRFVRILSGLLPALCLISFLADFSPVKVVLASGVIQSIVLPMIGGAALYFRYRKSDARLAPSKCWDVLLWLSAIGMLITGCWTLWSRISPLFN